MSLIVATFLIREYNDAWQKVVAPFLMSDVAKVVGVVFYTMAWQKLLRVSLVRDDGDVVEVVACFFFFFFTI